MLLFCSMSQSQELPNLVPPSPEAASLAKFVEMPVSHYNGTPNISIPLVTLSAGSIDIPVSLSYHAKGVQVAEIASRVGTGWTLIAGGSITRQIRDQADDSDGGFLNESYTQAFPTSPTVRQDVWNFDISPASDIEPDLFMFNFMGMSGKFIFDHKLGVKKPVLQKADDMEIIPGFNYGRIVEWTVIDANGTKYRFNSSEGYSSIAKQKMTDSSAGHESIEGYDPNWTTTWHLTKITTTNNDVVNFYYQNENIQFYQRTGDWLINNVSSCNFSITTMQQLQLSSIVSNEGSIVFQADTDSREDLQGGKTLKSVVLLDKENSQVSKFEFDYIYKTCTNANVNQAIWPDTHALKRLYLKHLWQEPGAEQMEYKFIYSNIDLPNRHSNAQDNWGYYNGKNNGAYMYSIHPKNRTVDVDLSEAGMLKKIIYPTGGYTEFVYEHNRLRTPSMYSSILMPANNPTVDIPAFSMFLGSTYIPAERAFVESFTIGGSKPVIVDTKILFSQNPTGPACVPGVDSGYCRYEVILYDSNSGIIQKLLLGNYNITLPPGTYTVKAFPPHGPPFPDYELDSYSVVLKWQEAAIDEAVELLGPGKRIKSIIKGDGNNILLKKDFSYTNGLGASYGELFSIPNYFHKLNYLPNGGLHVSGTLGNISTPLSSYSNGDLGYSKVTETQIGEGGNGKTEYFFTNYKDTGKFYMHPYHSPNDMSWTRGLPLEIIYSSSTGIGSGTVYRIEKTIKNNYVYFDNSSAPISGISGLTDPDPDPNLTIPTEDMDSNSIPYSVGWRKTIIPIYKPCEYTVNHNSNPLPYNTDLFIAAYFVAGRVDLSRSIETDYYYVAGNPVAKTLSKIRTFNYNSNLHHQLTSQTETTSTGETIVTNNYYPWDPLTFNEPAANRLREKHMFKNILATHTLTGGGTKLTRQVTKYKDWGSGIIAPELVEVGKDILPTEVKIRYSAYDDKGNPLQIEKENGMKTSYIWSYGKSLPVAKLENMEYANIPSQILEDIKIAANNSALGTALENLRNDTSADIQKSMITTYTYKPLVGPLSITDPKGDRIKYFYDSFGRLNLVLDKDGNAISKTKYHYRPPVN